MIAVDVDLIKRRNPIEQVMAAYGVKLQKRAGRFVGYCPFHQERHPSLVVYPDTKSFFCFGCRASGDAIDFVRRKEGLDFKEALRRLDTGAPGEPREVPADARLTTEGRLILSAACDLYHEALLQHGPALRYLEDRGVGMAVVRRCRLGFSDGRSLRPFLQRHRLSLRQAAQVGLLRNDGSEAFAGRVVISELRDGQCVWMIGRALDDHRLKYLGLSLPRPILGYERVRGQRRVFVTEGAFDYLSGLSWNLPICALLGTYARAERLLFLQRAREVVLVFDNDRPGQDAAAALASTVGASARILRLPQDVKDLSELASCDGGREIFFRLLANAREGWKEAGHASDR